MRADPALAAYYAQRAAEYERIYQKPERQQELLQLQSLVRKALAGRTTLELACGTGYWTQVAADTAASIAAFDINEAVLQIARRKPVDPRKAAFALGDAYHPPVAPHSFDAALAAFWWSHIPRARLADFLTSLHRALRPGATVVLIDNTYVPGESTPICRSDDAGNTYQLRRLGNGNAFEVLKNHPTATELHDVIAGAGGRAEVRWFKYYWWYSYRVAGASSAHHA